MEIKEQILVALGLNKVQSLKLEWQAKTEDGTILVSTAEELEAGVDISVLTEDGTTIPLPIGTYKTETGMSLRVEEEGIVAELIESESEEEEVVEEEEMEEEADVQDWAGMEKRIENLEIAVAKLKDGDMEKDDKEEEVEEEEMSAPSTNPKSIKTTEVVEFSLEELKEENERLKLELSKSPAEANLNTNKFSSEARNEGPTKKQLENMSASDKFLYSLQN
jgi:hypothetical protein|tara:strand:+ start:810 stop:1472 length:663 start_codon:yes stop_codon:yes gene_type:complete